LREEIQGQIFFYLPESVSTVFHFGEIIEGSGGGEEATFLLIWLAATEEIGEAVELVVGAGFHDAFGSGGGESFETMEAETQSLIVEDECFASGVENGDGFGADAATAGVAQKGRNRVESHGLIVDEAGKKFGGVVNLEPAGGVGDEGEGDGVAFRKAIESEGADGLDDLVLDEEVDVALGHAVTEFVADCVHAFVGAFEGHRAAEFIGLSAIEARDDHGHAENLFLKERDAESAAEDGFEGGVNEIDCFAAVASVEVRVDEVPDDGAGTDEGDFDGEVVECSGPHNGQSGHLGTGLDLKRAHRIGAAKEVVGRGVVVRNLGEVDRFAALVTDADAVFHGGEHAEAEEVDLDDAEAFTIVLVPLDDGAVGHGGGLKGNDGVQSVVADDHAAGVLAEVAREGEDFVVEMKECFEAGVSGGNAGLLDGFFEVGDFALGGIVVPRHLGRGRWGILNRGIATGGIVGLGGGGEIGEAVGDGVREAEDFGHFSEGGAGAVSDDVGGHGGAPRSVFLVDVLDDGFAAITGWEVDVDVGPGLAVFGEEAFEEKSAADGIAGGDFEAVANGGVGGGAAALAEDALGFGELDEFPDDEEVAGEAEAGDEGQFVFKLSADFPADFWVAFAGSLEGELAEEFDFLVGREWAAVLVEGGELVAEVCEGELEAVGEALSVEQGLGKIAEEFGDLLRVFEVTLRVGLEEGAGLVEGSVVAQAGEGVGEEAIRAIGEEGSVGGEKGEVEMFGEIEEEAVAGFFAAGVMAGESEVEVVLAELADEVLGGVEQILAGRMGKGFGGEEGDQAIGLRPQTGKGEGAGGSVWIAWCGRWRKEEF